MKRIVSLVILFVFALSLADLDAQSAGQDRRLIDDLIARVNYAWTIPNGTQAMSEVLSDSCLTVMTTSR